MVDRRADLVKKTLEAVRRKYGSEKVLVGRDMTRLNYIGVPIEPLCLQYLLYADIFPLEKLVHLYGAYETCKSSFGLYLIRLFIEAGGQGVYVDTEGKLPIDILKSLVGEENIEESKFFYQRVVSADEAQEFIFDYLKAGREITRRINEHNSNAEDEGRWPHSPTLILLDSLAGALPQDARSRLERDGHGSATVATYARVWTEPFAKMVEDLVGSMTTLVVVNHERMSINFGGRSTPGGDMQKFLGFLMLRFTHARGQANSQDDFKSFTRKYVRVSTDKNSMGARNREIELVAAWDKSADLNFRFELDLTSVELLRTLVKAGADLDPIKNITLYGGKYKCPDIGLDSYTDASGFMQYLEEQDLMEGLRKKLGIVPRCRLNSEEFFQTYGKS